MLQVNQLDGFWDDTVDFFQEAGDKVVDTVKKIPGALNTAAKATCGVISSTPAQSGAAMASNVPNPYAQGAAQAVQAANGICSVAYSGKTSTQAGQPSGKPGTLPPWIRGLKLARLKAGPVKTAAEQLIASAPTGSVQWKNLLGKWVIAVPIEAAKAAGLQGVSYMDVGGGRTLRPFGFNPHMFQRPNRDNYYSVVTADSPYKATWGVGRLTVVGETTSPVPGITQVTADKGAALTTPIYKKWWFWTAIGVATVGAGTGIYFAARD